MFAAARRVMLAWHSVALEGCSTVRSLAQRPLMTSRRYLITGGAGFLGINLCRYLLERGCYVRTLDIAPFAYPERARIDVIDGDVRDAAAVERAVAGVDIVVHGAAALPLAGMTALQALRDALGPF